MLCRNPHSGKMVPPCASPAPKGAGAHAMPPHFLYETLLKKKCFHTIEIEAAAGRPNGCGGMHLEGGMGASAPIITSNDSYRAKNATPIVAGIRIYPVIVKISIF